MIYQEYVSRYCHTCHGENTHRVLRGQGCVAYICIHCENFETQRRKHVLDSKTLQAGRPTFGH